MTLWVGSGGAWKLVPTPGVGASGAWKDIIGGWVGAGGAWKKFFSPSTIDLLNTTGVAGTDGSDVGWSGAYGSIGNTYTNDGKLLGFLADANGVDGTIVVAGFGSDPGQNGWATSFTINGTTLLAADATSFSGGTTSTWTWAGSPFGFVNTVAFTAVIE